MRNQGNNNRQTGRNNRPLGSDQTRRTQRRGPQGLIPRELLTQALEGAARTVPLPPAQSRPAQSRPSHSSSQSGQSSFRSTRSRSQPSREPRTQLNQPRTQPIQDQDLFNRPPFAMFPPFGGLGGLNRPASPQRRGGLPFDIQRMLQSQGLAAPFNLNFPLPELPPFPFDFPLPAGIFAPQPETEGPQQPRVHRNEGGVGAPNSEDDGIMLTFSFYLQVPEGEDGSASDGPIDMNATSRPIMRNLRPLRHRRTEQLRANVRETAELIAPMVIMRMVL
jgi:hypothetical protein